MLIKVTTSCQMACPHCMEECKPKGVHMDPNTFLDALLFSDRIERRSPVRLTMISGGEPTDHPDILPILDLASAHGAPPVMLLSNGLWLEDDDLREAILQRNILVQITNDPRFYPREPPRVEHPKIAYVDSLSVMIPMGRFKGRQHAEVPTRKGPTCFNLRSLTRSLGDVRKAVAMLRTRGAFSNLSGFCTPSISADGTVTAGECRGCHAIGTVRSSAEEITEALISMKCSECGLRDSLTQEQKRAIGESLLYSPHERW